MKKRGRKPSITPEQADAAILEHGGIAAAADALGVHRHTVATSGTRVHARAVYLTAEEAELWDGAPQARESVAAFLRLRRAFLRRRPVAVSEVVLGGGQSFEVRTLEAEPR